MKNRKIMSIKKLKNYIEVAHPDIIKDSQKAK